jgi:hypothetical protein
VFAILIDREEGALIAVRYIVSQPPIGFPVVPTLLGKIANGFDKLYDERFPGRHLERCYPGDPNAERQCQQKSCQHIPRSMMKESEISLFEGDRKLSRVRRQFCFHGDFLDEVLGE